MSEYQAGLMTGVALCILGGIFRSIFKSWQDHRYTDRLCEEGDECQCALRGE